MDFVNAKHRDALISQKTRTLLKKFARLFPDQPLEVAYSWAGTFGETKDGLAYIGTHPRFPHASFALGYGGNGITFSLIGAEIITDLIVSGKSKYADLFSFDRFRTLCRVLCFGGGINRPFTHGDRPENHQNRHSRSR